MASLLPGYLLHTYRSYVRTALKKGLTWQTPSIPSHRPSINSTSFSKLSQNLLYQIGNNTLLQQTVAPALSHTYLTLLLQQQLSHPTSQISQQQKTKEIKMTDQNYNVEQEIADFFSTKTRVTRNSCDEFAKKLIVEKSASGSTNTDTSTSTVRLEIVPTQGVCSYTVYAGTSNSNNNSSTLDWVVQFRLKSLALPMETMERARRIYGGLVPEVSLRGEMGGDEGGGDGNGNDDGRENLMVYVMPRMRGISRLEYILAHGFPEDGEKICEARERLVGDVAS